MTPLVLVILAVMWVLVLVPPLLRSRTDGRPNHSISSFQRQLRTLQRTGGYPGRGSVTYLRSQPWPAAAAVRRRPRPPRTRTATTTIALRLRRRLPRRLPAAGPASARRLPGRRCAARPRIGALAARGSCAGGARTCCSLLAGGASFTAVLAFGMGMSALRVGVRRLPGAPWCCTWSCSSRCAGPPSCASYRSGWSRMAA